ncbi:FHIP family protein GJ17503 isoform X2 [Anabrus simplex]|uniref:FHIP family protein GJ17503 isoform X2 n=1 Tax=Anabrus simplex TaxID=316456 RepID=UPI0035A360F8
MSWLRNSPLRASFGHKRGSTSSSPPKDCDPTACYESFKKHWQQTYEIIERTQPPVGYPIQDDVLGVVNHLDQMLTLLLLELRAVEADNQQSQSPCLEYLLSENLLDRLFAWSIHTGRYSNALRLEQLKLYELLVSQSRHQLLVHEPFLRPLLKLLASCTGEVFPVEVEKRLVVLLNQLCVSLMQNIELLDLFFYASPDQGPAKFVIFTLLIPFVHREGGIGQQARDALLLCMSLSKKNENVGSYIAEHSNVCPVLATGLSGLYSLLPRKLDIETEDWHRLTPDDVNDINELTMFMNSLEFCNAVVQVAHPVVKNQMLEFLYQGFLVPVMGPALLQSTADELVAATAYFDLFLRSITEPGLLYSFVRFLLEDKYDGERILDSLIQRINSKTRLCLVTLALFETLVDLNCEDVMLELVFRHLIPCTHVMLSQRRRVRDVDPYCRSSDKFLSLTPACCSTNIPASRPAPDIGVVSPSPSLPAVFSSSYHHRRSASFSDHQPASLPSTSNLYGLKVGESLYGNYHAYLCDARQRIKSCAEACTRWTYLYDGENPPHDALSADEKPEGKNCDINQSLSVIESVDTNKLDGRPAVNTTNIIIERVQDSSVCKLSKDLRLVNVSDTSPSQGLPSLKENHYPAEPCDSIEKSDCNVVEETINTSSYCHSLPSIGESSGYESIALKCSSESTPENEPSDEHPSEVDLGVSLDEVKTSHVARELPTTCEKPDRRPNNNDSGLQSATERIVAVRRLSSFSYSRGEDSSSTKSDVSAHARKFSRENSYLDIFNTTPNIGPFLDVLLRKLEGMMTNSLYVNLHLTGLISRLAVYPQPLLHSFLLNHSLVFQPSIRSLFQVLGTLKHKTDHYLARHRNVEEIVTQAQDFLVGREDRLANARRHALESTSPNSSTSRRNSITTDPFARGEPKRRSFSSTLSSVFRRATQPTSPQTIPENKLESTPDGGGYRYFRRSLLPGENSELRNVVMCAVILDEWLKELAAITQEQAVANLAGDFSEYVW